MSTATSAKPESLNPPPQITEVMEIAISMLAPSPTNPRKNFPEASIAEMASSIQATRQVQAGVCRALQATSEDVRLAKEAGFKPKFGPGDDFYRIVVGERRARGCNEAGKTFRAEVREMSDEQEQAEQIVENLRRQDLDAMEEAQGFQNLMDKGWTLQMIADRIGDQERSIKYVSASARLTALNDEGKLILRNNWTTPSHAKLIATLEPEDQERAWRAVFDPREFYKKVPLLELAENAQDADYRLLVEKELRDWIKGNINLQLKNAKWDLADKELFPDAGACTDCPFRSGNNVLFKELADTDSECMKPACWQEKGKLFVKQQIELAETTGRHLMPILVTKSGLHTPREGQRALKEGQWVPAKKGECKSTQEAVVMDGMSPGETRFVCADGDCKKHPHNWVDKQQPTASAKSASNGREEPDSADDEELPPSDMTPQKMEEQRLAQAAEREFAQNIESDTVFTVAGAEYKNTKKADRFLLRRVSELLLQSVEFDMDAIAHVAGLPKGTDPHITILPFINKATEQQLCGLLAVMLMGDYIHSGGEGFTEVAKRNNIDLKKLRKELEKKHSPKSSSSEKSPAKSASKPESAPKKSKQGKPSKAAKKKAKGKK